MQKPILQIVLGCCYVLFACNPTRIVQPIPEGQVQVGANFGGSVIKYGSAPIPTPLTSIYAAYGIKDHTTGFASLHTTALMYGVLQTDLGITRQLLAPDHLIPGVSVSPIANLMFDTWEHHFSFYPQLDVNAYWNYGTKKKLVYLSMNNWFELRTERPHGESQPNQWLPSFGLGHQWNYTKSGLQLELKWVAPTQSNENIVVDYVSFSPKGALGFYVGYHLKF